MPACVLTSPAVVMVRMPARKVSFSLGTGTGPQRSCPIGRSCSPRHGAVFQKGSDDLRELLSVLHRGADAVEPGALVGAARRGEGRARRAARRRAHRPRAAASSGRRGARPAAPPSRNRCRSPAYIRPASPASTAACRCPLSCCRQPCHVLQITPARRGRILRHDSRDGRASAKRRAPSLTAFRSRSETPDRPQRPKPGSPPPARPAPAPAGSRGGRGR